ncbi:MAG TPA: glycosyltransferase family 25 protein [Bacteroidales bacterium]|nr:glycosyltransferase family 25 protein [Bacteroidales bacterium]HPO65416.1 glycosyltransferase family 25 protein [Bacteroidales bacterium]
MIFIAKAYLLFMINKLLNEGVFVIHALHGYEPHERRIIELFGNKGINFEFVVEGDPSNFHKISLEKYFSKDIHKVLSRGTLSCTFNHILAYEKIMARNIEYAIVFENDPFFLGNFVEKLKRLFDEVQHLPPGFIISLENSTLRFPSYWQIRMGKQLYRARIGRMAGAYLIDRQAVINILNDIQYNKCDRVIDWWHNDLIQRGVIDMYWAHPPLVEQGSHNGMLSSTISTQSATLMRRLSWIAQKFYKYYIRRLFHEKNIIGTAF